MSGTNDKIKGRVKEAVGAMTDVQHLKDEGKLDQTIRKLSRPWSTRSRGQGNCEKGSRNGIAQLRRVPQWQGWNPDSKKPGSLNQSSKWTIRLTDGGVQSWAKQEVWQMWR